MTEEFLAITRIGNPCDLDLLVFFARHPDALMTNEQLASFVGYDLQQIVKSLDLLIERGLLRRTQHPTHPARLYRFRTDHCDRRFHKILEIACTVEGRRQIRSLLSEGQTDERANSPESFGRSRRTEVRSRTAEVGGETRPQALR